MNFFNLDNIKKNKIYVETQDYVKTLNTNKYVDNSDLFLVDNECSICLSDLYLMELDKKDWIFCASDIIKGSRLWQSRLAANDSQPASIKSGPFLKGATLRSFSRHTATRPRDIMVFPDPPFRAEIMILGEWFNIFSFSGMVLFMK